MLQKKKRLIFLLIASLVIIVSGCNKNENAVVEYTNNENVENANNSEKITIHSFLEKVDGYWGYNNSNGSWDILNFEEGKINDYTYNGHIWLSDGTIEKIEEVSNGALKATISYQEIVYGGGETPTDIKKAEYIFRSDDDFRRTLITPIQGSDCSYSYLGKTREEVDNYISKMEDNTHSHEVAQAQLSESELVKIAQKKLDVPEKQGITYKISEKSFWESGQTYEVMISFYENGKFVASAFVDTDNGELLHGIMSYSLTDYE